MITESGAASYDQRETEIINCKREQSGRGDREGRD